MKKRFQFRKKDGFTLIITIILMSMLTVLSIGLLTLGAVTLRGGTAAENKRTANANAQMALMLAIGELQKALGSDKRVTADASILKSGNSTNDPQDHMVGVWTSENPYTDTLTSVSSIAAPKYDKTQSFKKWLVSAPEPSDTENKDYATGSAASSGPVLFSTTLDGYELRGESVPISSGQDVTGSYAWAVSQENTKAKINVGTDLDRSLGNDGLQAPTRPDLKAGGTFTQPENGWDARNGRVISISQSVLDSAYGITKNKLPQVGPDYTATAQGVLADVAKGQLKTDLSLAFEMPQNSYQQSKWGSETNPFALGTKNDTPLFTPVTGNAGAPFTFPSTYVTASTPPEAIFAGAPPSFGTLRSYYRLYRHLYGSSGSPSVYQRRQQSTYWNVATGTYPAQTPLTGTGNMTSVGPILDRMFMVFGLYVTPDGQAAVTVTPIITLWNPYNVSLESDGFVAYPFLDMPSFYTIYKNGTNAYGSVMSQTAGLGLGEPGAGRQMDPYFYCQITNDGTTSLSKPIHFSPGEVKVFQPASNTPVVFRRSQVLTPKARVIPMVPANGAITATRGGIAYPCNQNMDTSKSLAVAKTDSLQLEIDFEVSTTTNSYRYGIALEDSTRIQNGYKTNIDKTAHIWNEIHVLPSPAAVTKMKSIPYPVTLLTSSPQPGPVIESYHRTELNAAGTTVSADLLLSTNIRQRYQHPLLTPTTNFTNGTGPVYETHMKTVANFNDIGLQMNQSGSSYYGMSNSASNGLSNLSLFDIPHEPLLSLGSFQNADLTDMVCASSYQFGNSWATPYVGRAATGALYRQHLTTGDRYTPGLALYDTSYLSNAAVWDSYYFSSIAPRTSISSGSASDSNYINDASQVSETSSLSKVISAWIDDPTGSPLRNSRHLFHLGNASKDDLKTSLADPKGALDAAAHILVDGAFNVNSTSLAAWQSVLSSARGDTFTIQGTNNNGTYKGGGDNTPFSRLRYPAGPALPSNGQQSDKWNGFRELSDDEIKALAQAIVTEVKKRGPFQSMADFVNRKLDTSDQGLAGAVQTAIDNSNINSHYAGATVSAAQLGSWGSSFSGNFKKPVDVSTAAPGWLTQADVLTPLAPFITVRSDTFTVRGYGEARDTDNKIAARSWCEATVQRVPEFVDSTNDPVTALADLNTMNTNFGRQFQIIAFRWVAPEEIEPS